MKQVQDALKDVIQAYQDAYRPVTSNEKMPDQYAAYTTMTVEEWHADDVCQALKTYVYMNLWSTKDPTDMAKKIRAAMRNAGFAMDEESTGATDGESYYTEGSNMFCIRWTWVYREDVADGDEY